MMDSFAVLFIFVAVVAVVQVYKWLQVTQAARCAFEQLSLEGLKKLAVDEADKDGMVQFYLVGKPWISVLKAEHVRQVLNVSNFRRSNPIMKLSSKKELSLLLGQPWKLHRQWLPKPLDGKIALVFADRLILVSYCMAVVT
ncbi:hypothetical protein AeRB84_005724 [Aphanomyces euteiches]|nr:hypothetical protein AeRB84_005724 [Aphanomyces euteiches]